MKTYIAAAFLGAATAVRWELEKAQDGYSAYLDVEPQLPDFDPAEVADWWNDVYWPMLEYHAYDIAMSSWEEMKNDGRAALLEVCEEGQKCRDDVDQWMREEIQKTWKAVLNSLKSQIQTTTTLTKEHLDTAWKEQVICEETFPCCEYSEEEMKNTKITIRTKKDKLRAYYEEWWALEQSRIEMRKECPHPQFHPSCSEHGLEVSPAVHYYEPANNLSWDYYNPCWDGEARLDDDYCECANPWVEPECAVTVCPENHTFNATSCMCDAPAVNPIDFNFVCDPCEDGTIPEFPACICTTKVSYCNECWDGSVPDIEEDPTCMCPERILCQVGSWLSPENDCRVCNNGCAECEDLTAICTKCEEGLTLQTNERDCA